MLSWGEGVRRGEEMGRERERERVREGREGRKKEGREEQVDRETLVFFSSYKDANPIIGAPPS